MIVEEIEGSDEQEEAEGSNEDRILTRDGLMFTKEMLNLGDLERSKLSIKGKQGIECINYLLKQAENLTATSYRKGRGNLSVCDFAKRFR